MTDDRSEGLTRRTALRALAGGASLLAARALAAPKPAMAALPPGTNVCVLTPQAVEGPFYLDPHLMRSDIVEDRKGVPLRLSLQLIDARDCTPLSGARADIWHSDALGAYSGYEGQGDSRTLSTKGQHFLRGSQVSDAAGALGFQTIYPGWYGGRTPHIHLKVLLDQRNVLTSQIYFPDALSEYLFANAPPYRDRKATRDTVNATDGVLAMSGGGHTSFCSIKEEADCYAATLVVGVDRTALAPPEMHRGPPPGMGPGRGPGMGPPPPGFGPPPGGPGPRPHGSLIPGVASNS